MALPKSIRPEYSTTIPSTGKKIKYQPFSVKEEKVLVLAAESQDLDEIANAITNVLEACITSPADLKVSELAIFDIEYLFLRTRAKSAGEDLTVRISDPSGDNYSVEHTIQIDKIQVQKTTGHTDLIDINDDVKVKMKYPGIQFFTEGLKIDGYEESLKTVSKCISQIVIGEEVYNQVDMTEDEAEEWVEGLTTEQFSRILEFFKTMPKLKHTIKKKNPNTGNDFVVELEGLADFF